jgi:hypothetical protein
VRFEYTALAFRQQNNSPIEVAFVAHSLDILEWAGVPRKSDEMLTGYQRFLNRHRINQDIVPYFQEPKNCSPTAVIVALRKDAGLGRCLLENANIGPGELITTKLVIEVDEDSLETDSVFEAALRYVNSRLGTQEAFPSLDEGPEEEPFDEEELEEEEEEADEGDDSEDTINLGSKTLMSLRDMLDDRNNWSRHEFRQAISDFVKPALIIDGQHRVYGAAKIGAKGLPFIVCGLYDPSWEEQVFQFTVVNLRPRRIPPSVITSIAALSLTRSELDRLESRLTQAGVKMAEVTMMSLVAYDDKSPFASMIEMHIRDSEGRGDHLGYGAMKRIAKIWYRGSRKSLTLIAKNLFATNNITTARKEWRESRAWFEFFCLFWGEVRDRHPADLWEKSPNNRLLIGAHLWALQEAILTSADGQVPSHWKIKDDEIPYEERLEHLRGRFREILGEALKCFPVELWTRPWTKASQDTNAGRKDLADIFKKFIEEGQKGGRWKAWVNHELFRIQGQ